MQTDIQSQGFTLTDGLRHGNETTTRGTMRQPSINEPAQRSGFKPAPLKSIHIGTILQ